MVPSPLGIPPEQPGTLILIHADRIEHTLTVMASQSAFSPTRRWKSGARCCREVVRGHRAEQAYPNPRFPVRGQIRQSLFQIVLAAGLDQ